MTNLPINGPKLSRRARLQRDKVTGGPILLYPEGVLVLNATGEVILQLCDGARSEDGIVDHLCKEYNAPREVIAADVRKILQKVTNLNLLTFPPTASATSPE